MQKIPTKQWPKDLQKIPCGKKLEAGLLKGDLITVYTEKIPQVKCLVNASRGRLTKSDAWKLKGEQRSEKEQYGA